jgi:hypothetical protein
MAQTMLMTGGDWWSRPTKNLVSLVAFSKVASSAMLTSSTYLRDIAGTTISYPNYPSYPLERVIFSPT